MRVSLASTGMFLAALTLAGCRDDDATGADPDAGARLAVFVPSQDVTLAQQFNSGLTNRERLVVRSAPEWPVIWLRIHAGQEPPPDAIQPDFSAEMAVVAALGERQSGGFEIVIDSVTQYERGSIVYLTEKAPGPNCMSTGAMTQPVHAVRAPRTDGTIWWRERSVVNDC